MHSISRRSILQGFAATAATAALPASLAALSPDLSAGRPAPSDRRFSSPAIEAVIARMKQRIADPMLGMMFERCFPNTLDTTVFPETLEGKPDTYVITGDIDAMWLRDSSAQVWPYIQFATQDPRLASLL